MNGKFFLICLSFLLTSLAHSHPCDSILDSKLLDESSVKNQTDRKAASAYKRCMKQSSGSSSSGQIGVEEIEIGGNSASSSAMEDCTNASNNEVSSYYYYAAQKGLKESAVEGWRSCMLNSENLQCWPSPKNDPREFVINVSWKNGSLKLPKVVTSPITNGFVFGETVKNVLLPTGVEVPYGSQSIIVVRDVDNKPVSMVLNVLHEDRVSYSCSIAVPPLVHAVPKQASANFIAECNSVLHRIAVSKSAQVSSYPPEIVACASKAKFDQGKIVDVPTACKSFLSDDKQRRMLDNTAAWMRTIESLKAEGQGLSEKYGIDCPIPTY